MKKLADEIKVDKHGETEEKPGFWAEFFDYLKTIAIVVVLVFLLNHFVVINAKIPSESMQNTIMVGDQIFGNRLAYLNSDPERFDIVIFEYPDDPSQLYIKRVIGLPGETVEIRDGLVYIDGSETPLDDSFCPETPIGNYGPYEVPEESYFMLGDNRNWSKDSRFWRDTFVEKDEIQGKAGFRYWPLNKMGVVK